MLKKQNRLLEKYEINKTKRLGKKVNAELFYLFSLNVKDYFGETKVGFVTTTRFDKKAVVRNRAKRVLREVFRKNFDKIELGYFILVYPKTLIKEKVYEEVNSDFNKHLSTFPFSK